MKQASITFTDYGDGKCIIGTDPPDLLHRDIETLNEIELNALKGLLAIRKSDMFEHHILDKNKT